MRQLVEVSEVQVRSASIHDAATILGLWQSSARWLLSNGINQWRLESFWVMVMSIILMVSSISINRKWNKKLENDERIIARLDLILNKN